MTRELIMIIIIILKKHLLIDNLINVNYITTIFFFKKKHLSIDNDSKAKTKFQKPDNYLLCDSDVEVVLCKLYKVYEFVFINETVVVGVCILQHLVALPRSKETNSELESFMQFVFADSTIFVCVK